MSRSQSTIPIVDGSTQEAIEAILLDSIEGRHNLDCYENCWRPWLERVQAENPELKEQSAHWDWRGKMSNIGGGARFVSFAIECRGHTQGLMIADTEMLCRIDSSLGKSLVYVKYLQAAPWNRDALTSTRCYKRVGPAFVSVAILLSRQKGLDGRIGLHSLPQSEDWYRDKCRMTDLGIDLGEEGLRYFEMTTEQADAFMGNSV